MAISLHLALQIVASVLFAVAAVGPSSRVRWEWLAVCALSLTLWI